MLFRVVVQILQQEGIRGFYRGCVANLFRTTPAAVITFTSFELLLRHLPKFFPPNSPPQVRVVKTSLHSSSLKPRVCE